MNREFALKRTSDKAIAYIENYVRLVGADKKEHVLELFDNMHRFFPQWVISTCPVMHPNIHYVSGNAPFVFGYSIDYLIGHSRIEKFFQHIHEADQEDFHECISTMQDFLEGLQPEEHHLYRFIFHYRFRRENGQYIHLHDEKASLHLPDAGNLYYALFRDITTDRAFTGVKAEIFKQEETVRKIKEFRPSLERNALSKREAQLITLIKQGLSTKEIAWHLAISHNTVRNIKSRLFEKYNVNNSIELLNMTG
jgi:DNA-binding CsgD family transcriptional regulator